MFFCTQSEGGSGEVTRLPSVTNLTNEKPESNGGSGIDTNEQTIKLPPVTAAVSKAPPLPPPPTIPYVVAKGDTGRSVLIQLQQQVWLIM